MKQASIMFSGGIDSSLAGALTLDKYEKIHLLTYHHCFIWQIYKTKKQFKRFKKCYGNRVCHEIMGVNNYFRKIYYSDFVHDLKKYKSLMFLMICAACKFAMHTKTIIYSLENNIDHAADGAYQKQNVFVAQMEEVISEMIKFYGDYRITHATPVYYFQEKNAINKKLYELGITPKENYQIKWPMQTDAFIFAETQPTCLMGNPTGGFSKFIYAPVHGHKKRLDLSLDYFYEKSVIMREIIKKYFLKKGINIEDLIKQRELVNIEPHKKIDNF